MVVCFEAGAADAATFVGMAATVKGAVTFDVDGFAADTTRDADTLGAEAFTATGAAFLMATTGALGTTGTSAGLLFCATGRDFDTDSGYFSTYEPSPPCCLLEEEEEEEVNDGMENEEEEEEVVEEARMVGTGPATNEFTVLSTAPTAARGKPLRINGAPSNAESADSYVPNPSKLNPNT